MYTGKKDDEYEFVDSICEEQYLIGGVTAWVYAYQGPKGNKGSTDLTKPDYETIASNITDIGNLIWMENANRSYSIDAVALPVIYQPQDPSMGLQIPGLFLFETMDVTLPYNLMIRSLGRKIMNGDVIELANLRDQDLLDGNEKSINRFYVVHDAFRSGEGYSHMWTSHIWKMRLVPITNSPEFKDILGTAENEDDLNSYISSQNKELDIMDLIVQQADSEVPYMHWDNEHIHNPLALDDIKNIPTGYTYPVDPKHGSLFIKKTFPELFEWVDNSWVKIECSFGSNPEKLPANDGDFFWVYGRSKKYDYTLLQYDVNVWKDVIIETSSELPLKSTDNGFIVIRINDTPVLSYDLPSGTWNEFISDPKGNNMISNKYNIQDQREYPIPDINTVDKGTEFPQDPTDGMWFLRSDYTPPVLWKYENAKWRKFNYSGRFQWTGTDAYRASFVNNKETYTDSDNNQKSSRQSSSDTLKP